jgi:deoxyhypusine synthase
LITGGGVPKHYVAMAVQIGPRPLNYAIQITLDRPEGGGVSGAKLEEAKSWRKVAADAKTVDLICDATIALPLIVSAILSRVK